MIIYIILLIVTGAVAYAMGSMSTMVLASNFIFHYNLRRLGRGNDFLSNFKRIYGVKGALELLLVEAVKDVVPLVIGGLLLGIRGHAEVGRAFAGFCLVMGRLWPVFYNLSGSHAIMPLVLTGIFCGTSLGIAVAVVFLGLLIFAKYMSLASIGAAAAMAVASLLIVENKTAIFLCVLAAGAVIVKHIPALVRLLKGGSREEKITFKEDLRYKLDSRF